MDHLAGHAFIEAAYDVELVWYAIMFHYLPYSAPLDHVERLPEVYEIHVGSCLPFN